MIARQADDRAAAADYLRRALELNPGFDLRQSDIARRTLKEMSPDIRFGERGRPTAESSRSRDTWRARQVSSRSHARECFWRGAKSSVRGARAPLLCAASLLFAWPALAHDLPVSYFDLRVTNAGIEATLESSAKNFARELFRADEEGLLLHRRVRDLPC
jgi:hypothetical protein